MEYINTSSFRHFLEISSIVPERSDFIILISSFILLNNFSFSERVLFLLWIKFSNLLNS